MKSWLKDHPVIRMLIASVLLEFALETLFRHNPIKAALFVWHKPHLFLLNVLIVLATYSISAPFRKRFAIQTSVTILWLTFGVANFFISLFRQLPFTLVDLLLLKELFSLIHVYFNPFEIAMMFAAIAGVVVSIALLFIKSKKKPRLPFSQWLPMVTTPALLSLLLIMLGTRLGVVDSEFLNLSMSYEQNGFAYCFVRTFADVGMSKPETYSPETISELDEEIFEDAPGSGIDADKRPNVVYLQLESFFDLKNVIGLELEEDPTPTFTALKAGYPSGYLYVPTSGGGTVNTEMEILTGMNIGYFGAGEYPYYTVLQQSCCESLAYDLGELGYTATAIHNNSGSFYTRNEVYARLGFHRFDSVEYMSDLTHTPMGWARDNVLLDEILLAMESTDTPDFVFAVGVQTHGAYPNEPDYGRSMLELGAGEVGINQYSLEYYIDQSREVDAFLSDLLDALEKFDEPVVLVVYGDHLPPLNLTNEMLTTGDLFTSEYAIWSNYGLRCPDKDLEAYQLSAHALELMGIEHGTLFYFHQTRADTENYLSELNLLQYDMLYGDYSIYGGTIPYEATDMKMGLRKIELTSAKMQYGYLSVTGRGFTPSSRVYVNGELRDTLFVDENRLIVADFVPGTDELFTVGQVSDDQIALSLTDPVPLTTDEED